MRVLLDECLPSRLARELIGHEATTVRRMLWTGLRNGQLLSRAAEQFEVFITVDKSIEFQQRLPTSLAFITLRAVSNDIGTLRPLVPAILRALEVIRPGEKNADRALAGRAKSGGSLDQETYIYYWYDESKKKA